MECDQMRFIFFIVFLEVLTLLPLVVHYLDPIGEKVIKRCDIIKWIFQPTLMCVFVCFYIYIYPHTHTSSKECSLTWALVKCSRWIVSYKYKGFKLIYIYPYLGEKWVHAFLKNIIVQTIPSKFELGLQIPLYLLISGYAQLPIFIRVG